MARLRIRALVSEGLQSLALMVVLASCSQIVILQPADIIEEDAPTISFESITPGVFSSTSSVVRVFGQTSENAQIVTLYSDEECSQLLGAGTPSEFSSLGLALTLGTESSTSIHGLAKTESGVESECTHLVDFTHTSAPALGIALASPSSSPGNDSTPSFTVSVDGGALLDAGDKITLHSGVSCSGAPLNVDEATVSTDTVDGVSLSSTTLTLAASSAQVLGGALYSVKRVDSEGNEKCSSEFSVSGDRFAFYEFDNVNPAVPACLAPASHSPGDSINDTTINFSCGPNSVEPGAAVEINITGGGGSSCTTTAAGDGSFTCNALPALTGGASVALNVSVVQTDVAGNMGSDVNFALTLDTVAPGSATIASPSSMDLINDTTPTVSGSAGSAEAGATINVRVTGGGDGSCTTTAAGDGSWSCDVSTLTGGASVGLSISVSQTDAAGNESFTPATNVTLDTLAPSAPLISFPTNNFTTTTGAIGVSGTAEMNATVEVTVDGESADCSDTANGAGAWSCVLDESLENGTYSIRVTQTDAAGNGPSTAAVHTVTVDTPYRWSHQAYLKAPNPSNSDSFGNSISLSGNTVAVGSVAEDSSTTFIVHGTNLSATDDLGTNMGAVYIFQRSSDTWVHQAYLKAPNTMNYAEFGYSVSLTGDTAVVGARTEDSNTTTIINGSDLSASNDSGSNNGAVYVFERTGSTWALQAYLKAPNSSNFDNFGEIVSISEDTVAVGAPFEDSSTTSIIHGSDLSSTDGASSTSGAVYVFKRSEQTWEHQAYLKAPNNDNGDQFGISVNISGDTLAVSSTSEDSTTTSIINGSDLSTSNNFGNNNGAVYIFERTGDTWVHQAYLKAPNSASLAQFGYDVSLSGDTLAVGARYEAASTRNIIHGTDLSAATYDGSGNGAVYIFQRTGTSWQHQAYLKAPNNTGAFNFGENLSLSGDFVAVGAARETSLTNSIIHGSNLDATNTSGSLVGAVYVFRRNGSTWSHHGYLKAPNSATLAFFSSSVSLSSDSVAVGAQWEKSTTNSIIHGSDLSAANSDGSSVGAAYIFKLSDLPATPGIAFQNPASSPGTDSTPSFTIDFSGEVLVATDIVELYGRVDCGGDALDIDEATIGSDQFNGSTASSIVLTVAAADAQTEGSRAYSVKRTNSDGYSVCSSANGEPEKQFVSYVYDNTPPADVVITAPADSAFTNDDQFTVSGTGLEEGATVNVSVTGGGGAGCSTSTDLGGGNWSCTLDRALTGGAAVALTVSASQTDVAGNSSVGTDSHSVTLDTVAPGAPVISSPADSSTETTGTFTVGGTAEADATIAVTVDGETADCSDTADGVGAWSCVLDEALSDGSYTVRVTQTDEAGNGPSTADTHSVTVAIPTAPQWSHQAYLKALNTTNDDRFGKSVSVSGDTVAVGSYYEDSDSSSIIHGSDLSAANDAESNNGSVYVYQRTGDNWANQAYLKSPRSGSNDNFGISVSLQGNMLAVGANGENSNTTSIIHGSDLSSANDSGSANGAVHMFERVGSTWTHESYLKAPITSNFDNFGVSVSLSGDTVLVGAHGESSTTTDIVNGSDLSSTNLSGSANGAAYVFRKAGGVWSLEAYLKAPNADDADRFGDSVHLSGDTALIGTHDEKSRTTAIIHGSDLSSTDNLGLANGAAYVFRRTGSTWAHEAYLKAPNGEDGDEFAFSVSLSGDTALIGSTEEDSNTTSIINGSDLSSANNSGLRNGAAYVFRRSSGLWSMEAYLKAPNSFSNEYFGWSVDVSGDTAIVGAPGERSNSVAVINGDDLSGSNTSGDWNGAAYVFRRDGSTWTHEAYLKSPNNSNQDLFGRSVAISGKTAIVGATREDSNSTAIINGADLSTSNDSGDDNGAAYVFTATEIPLPPGIAFNTPASSPSDRSEPNFTIDFSGDNLVASDIIELYRDIDCGGDPIDIGEATIGSDQLNGSTASSITLSVTPGSAQTPNTIAYYSVKRTNAGGYSVCSSANSDATKQFLQYEVDTTPPADVTISSPLDSTITNNPQFTVSGSGLESGATVNVSVTGSGTASCSTSTDNGGGTWSCTLTSALTDSASAALTVTADQEDVAGNTSTTPDTISLTLDTVDPTAPSVVSPSGGATLSSGTVLVSGTAEFNATVDVTVDGETADCSATANGAGAWSCTLDEVLADASYTIRAVQTDAAGNGPSTATTVSVTVAIVPYQWSHQAYLKAPNGTNSDGFGHSVSINADTAVVGAHSEDSSTTVVINGSDLSSTDNSRNGAGAVYVFKRTGSTWAHEAYLKPPESTTFDTFSSSVDISGDTIVVGASNEDSDTTSIINGSDLSTTNDDGNGTGAAYIYKRSGSTWSHEAYLKAPNASDGDQFGNDVGISGNTVMVAAYYETSTTTSIINGTNLSATNDSGNRNGAVYVFTRSGSTWTHEAYLKSPRTSSLDVFGTISSISGDTIVVGAPAEDSNTTSIIHGSNLSSANDSGSSNGAAYVFTRSGSTWTHEAYLKAPITNDLDVFGTSVSISGDTIIVGAQGEESTTSSVINGSDLSSTNTSGDNNGAAYVFKRSSGTWSLEAYLKAPNTSSQDFFGMTVSIDGDLAIAGSAYEDSNTTSIVNGTTISGTNNSGDANGAAYAFRRDGSTWSHMAYLKASNTSDLDQFGSVVDISGDTAIVGAFGEDSATTTIVNGADLSSTDDGGFGRGAAYIFTVSDLPIAPGITLTPASDGTNYPAFEIDYQSGPDADLYRSADCGGEALDADKTTVFGGGGPTRYITPKVTETIPVGVSIYSVKYTNLDGYTVCSSADDDASKQWVEYDYNP